MKPYFETKLGKLYCGDCLEIMSEFSDKHFNLCLTDPPYGIGLDMVYKHGTKKNEIHEEIEWNNNPPEKYHFEFIYRISRDQIIFGCNYFGGNIKSIGRIIHDKQLCIKGTKLKWSEADIASCSLQNRITIFRYRWNGNVQGDTINWHNTGPDARVHPTQKPICLMGYCLSEYTKEKDLILDPFLGSGTTAIACEKLNRRWIGIEISEKYCEIAAKRIEAESKQGKFEFI